MKIGLMALSDNCAERGFISSCHELRGTLQKFGNCRLEYCGDIRSLFAGMVEALKSVDAVVVAVSPRHYIRCKKKLIAALGVSAVRDTDLSARISACAPGTIGAERAQEHALVARGAVVFPSPDGLYSGFAVESENQHIIFVATDGKRLSAVISEHLIPYFSRISGITPAEKAEADAPEEENAADEAVPIPPAPVPAVPEAPEVPAPAGDALPEEEGPSPEEAPADDAAMQRAAPPDPESAASAAIEALMKKKCTVAFAQTKTSAVVREFAERVGSPDDTFVFSTYTLDRRGENPREYVARLAAGALEEEGTDYGAAISNVFASGPEGAEMFVYIAAADDRGAFVRRLYLQEGERAQDLVAAAVCDLFACLEKLAGGDVRRLSGSAPVIVAPDEETEEHPRRISTKTKVISGVCVAVLLIVCIVMGICLRSPAVSAFNVEDALDTTSYHVQRNAVSRAVTNPTETAEITTEESTTAEPATKPVAPVAKPQNSQEEAGGVGGGQPAEKPVIVGEDDPENNDAAEEPTASFSGTFTITTYGYGHGVGMSQWGANSLAKEGQTYDWIICHYYPGAALTVDASAGQPGIPSADDIARVVQQEMGSGFETEALKAQAVAAYTYARYNGNSISGMASVSDISKVSDKVRSAVAAVYGQMAVYNGRPINAVFHAMSAGTTAASQTIWGGSIPYLTPVSSPGDTRQNNYKVTRTYSAQEMAQILGESLGVTMSGDPAQWFTILEHDTAVSNEIGYVKKMRIQIGSNQYTDIGGNYFRESVMGYSRMRSPCFTITYTA